LDRLRSVKEERKRGGWRREIGVMCSANGLERLASAKVNNTDDKDEGQSGEWGKWNYR